MSSKPLLLLDFDWTLFNYGKFLDAAWEELAKEYGVDIKKEAIAASKFSRYLDDFCDYDFFAHIDSLQIGGASRVEQFLRTKLSGRQFLFDDALSALVFGLQFELRILTFGNTRYQSFKLSLCPELKDIPTDITLTRKGDFVARRYGDQHLTVVDDKQLAGTLPKNAAFIRLDRAQVEPIKKLPGYTVIQSLFQLPKVVRG